MRAAILILILYGFSMSFSGQLYAQFADDLESLETHLFFLGQLDSAQVYFDKLSDELDHSATEYALYQLALSADDDSTDLSPAFSALYDDLAPNSLTRIKAALLHGQYLLRNEKLLEGEELLLNEVAHYTDQPLTLESDLKADLISLLAAQLSRRGNLLKAHEYAKRAEALIDPSKNDVARIAVYRSLAAIYKDLSLSDLKFGTEEERTNFIALSQKYSSRNLALAKKLGIKKMTSMCYYDMGISYINSSQYDSARIYLDSTIIDAQSIGNQEITAMAYNAITNSYFARARTTHRIDAKLAQMYLDTAGMMIDSAAKYAASTKNQNLKININLTKANKLTGQNRFKEALPYVEDAIIQSQRINSHIKLRLAYHTHYVISKYSGDDKAALEYYIKAIAERDSILNKENKSRIDELNKKYENEKILKENLQLSTTNDIQRLQLSKKNLLLFILGILGLAIPSFIYLFYHKKSIDQERRTLKAEQKLLRSQLNPHFLYNALNAIQQYIYQQKDPTIVADYLAKFSRLTRQILLYSREEFIPIEDEIKFLRDYIDLQQIRFDVPFTYEIEIDPEIIDDDIMIPPMFTQPFLENSIEHGILSKRGEGKIKVKMSKSDNSLIIEIEDNGIGINRAAFEQRNKEHRSLAMEITRERLSNISKIEKAKTNLVIKDLSDINNLITGTLAILTLPLIHE